MAAVRSRAPEIQHLAMDAKNQVKPGIQNESRRVGSEVSTGTAPVNQTEVSDMSNPPAPRKRGIPGVKIVKSRPK